MTPSGASTPDDRLIESPQATSLASPLLRIAGVEPHGWSTILLEDDSGRFYVAVTASGRLSEVSRAEAGDLLRIRTYREWHGDRSWSPFERLPLIGGDFAEPPPTASAPIDSTP